MEFKFSWLLAFYTAAVAWGFIGSSYRYHAAQYGWPTGLAMVSSWAVIAVAAVPISMVMVWVHAGWLEALSSLAAGFVLAWVLTETLRQYVQVLWVLAPLVVAGAVIFGVARDVMLWP